MAVPNPPCPKCGSTDVILADVADHYGESGTLTTGLSLRVTRDPSALLFKKSVEVNLRARACGGCGYVELYLEEPAKLSAAYRDHLANERS
jgi:predicted nucleic-acid-binding Zn-ribbon protein